MSPNSNGMPLITPVSSDDRFHLARTPETLDPSAPSVVPEEHPDHNMHEPVDDDSDEELAMGPRRQIAIPVKGHQKLAMDYDDGYQPDTAVEFEDDEDSSDEDDGLHMSARKSVSPNMMRSISVGVARDRERHGSNVSKKSSRSGSNKTAAKVPSGNAGDNAHKVIRRPAAFALEDDDSD